MTIDNALTAKIESLLDKSKEHWTWAGSTNQKGYQQISFNKKVYSVRSLIYQIYIDDSATETIKLTCSFKNCLNPEHMIEGAHLDATIRFWKHVNILGMNDCWVWVGAKDTKNYGNFNIGKGKYIKASRFSYMIHNKGENIQNLEVCHKCDNPSCVNPGHLFLGSRQDNATDMVVKNRSLFGEKNKSHKFSNKDVEKMRSLSQEGLTVKEIAEIFQGNVNYISEIVRYEKRIKG